MTSWRTGRRLRLRRDEHLDGDALALAQQAQQDVLGADVVVTQLQRLAEAQLEHLLRPRREGDVPGGGLLALADDVAHLLAHGIEGTPEGFERLGADSLVLVDQTEQDVLGADVIVVQQPCLSSCARTTTRRARSVNLSNMSLLRALDGSARHARTRRVSTEISVRPLGSRVRRGHIRFAAYPRARRRRLPPTSDLDGSNPRVSRRSAVVVLPEHRVIDIRCYRLS